MDTFVATFQENYQTCDSFFSAIWREQNDDPARPAARRIESAMAHILETRSAIANAQAWLSPVKLNYECH